ncbi:MAG: hypothetical protein IJB55_03560 [Firmicutes bacterium]|nr:hypothetical protein [Bacillota bacterium]
MAGIGAESMRGVGSAFLLLRVWLIAGMVLRSGNLADLCIMGGVFCGFGGQESQNTLNTQLIFT